MTKTEQALRDRFFQLHLGKATAADAAALRAEVNAVELEPQTRVGGIRVSAFPTRTFKAVRFFDASLVPQSARDDFARPLPKLPQLAAGFVDPQEYSFRTFENIVSLDGYFDGLALDQLKLDQRSRFGDKQVYTFTLSANDEVRSRLSQLDELGLYVPPLNPGSRGGERYIFHSAALADALTQAVKTGLGAVVREGFSHVNPVFRCNRFKPADDKFHRHLDTPYFDEGRKQVSRYTLLLYLTGGSAGPALEVDGSPVLTKVAPFTCVVMDQSLEHEGRPFDDARKVFLRTELIFDQQKLTHDPAIGAAFAQAVYLTGESVFAPELERHAEAAYNRVADAHWRGLSKTPAAPLVHKNFRGLQFVTNGYDFYFPKNEASLQESAAIALLDFFNAEVGGSPFRKACNTRPLPAGANAVETLKPCTPLAEPVVGTLDKAALLPPPETADENVCCPFHSMAFRASRCGEIIELYQEASAFVRERLLPAPVMVMGDQVLLDPSRFAVDGDRLHVLSASRLSPVNFAACWNSGGMPESYLGVETSVNPLQPLVPPILFGSEGGCWHLRFDFFRNSWLVSLEQNELPIPVICDHDPGEVEEGTAGGDGEMFELSKRSARPPRTAISWGNDSPLLRQLSAHRPKL